MITIKKQENNKAFIMEGDYETMLSIYEALEKDYEKEIHSSGRFRKEDMSFYLKENAGKISLHKFENRATLSFADMPEAEKMVNFIKKAVEAKELEFTNKETKNIKANETPTEQLNNTNFKSNEAVKSNLSATINVKNLKESKPKRKIIIASVDTVYYPDEIPAKKRKQSLPAKPITSF
jgi:hypothetical protein